MATIQNFTADDSSGVGTDSSSRATGEQLGGYEYAGGIDTSRIFTPWPLIPGDTQGIALDPLWNEMPDGGPLNNTEGPSAIPYYNGGVYQTPVPGLGMFPKYQENDVDERSSAWNSGTVQPAPYQLDTNMIGPVTGHSEGMNGNTLQPDYVPQGQYGASTGGGTSQHETYTAYYMSQVDQVQRDYAAGALFASI
jgi:hypothetical protein